jgi:very-short-patch-repair endonuclease
MTRKKSLDEVKSAFKLVHGDLYDYSEFKEYKGTDVKIAIICKEHKEFEQTPYKHLKGQGCPECGKIKTHEKQKNTINEFIEKAKKIHGLRYDYSKVKYVNSFTKVIIMCEEHDEFEQQPNNHLQGNGCPGCRLDNMGKWNKSNKEEFISKAMKVHGDKYDYSQVDYEGANIEVKIICKLHGIFQQQPSVHISGCGCNVCGIVARSLKTRSSTEEFILKAKDIHGDKYDYTLVDYETSNIEVKIICKDHGVFLQTPQTHLSGSGCNDCAIITRSLKQRSSTEEFILKAKEIHGNKYDYSRVEYINLKTKVTIICKDHDDFMQTAGDHLQGYGCNKCGRNNTSEKQKGSIEEFISKSKNVHGDKYDYSKVIYNNAREKIEIICKKHGKFLQIPDAHVRGVGCPFCVNKTEAKLYEKLVLVYPTLITQFKQEWCKRVMCLPFDFCIPESKIIIELDGPQHFQQISNWTFPEEQLENDKYKEKCANDNGYSIIRIIQEDVFYDCYDWEKELCETIEELKIGDEIANVYLCKNREYKNY